MTDARSHDAATSSVPDHESPDPEREEASALPLAIGRYPILRRLGAGGMGVVYAAYDEVLDRRIAIKVIHDHVWDIGGRRRERLLREAQALARVAHPNVITVHDVGTADDQLFVAMEFVAGPTLKDWLAADKRSWREIVAVFQQVAEGLAAIHDADLVHRDVKPTNVMIGSDGRARVLDLGLATLGSEESSVSPRVTLETPAQASSSSPSSFSFNRIASLTRTGELLGTPAYMSREQFLGLELTPASDIFSLSVALYEALYGVHPFMAKTFAELQAKVVDGRITPPPSSSAVPAWLHALVVRGLAKEPKDRPPSMRALSDALTKDPSRARRRWLGSFGLAAITASAGVLVTQVSTTPSPPICDGAELAIAEVWNPDRAAEIHAALVASERPYAAALAGRITDALDDYAHDWTEAHQRSCLEHARGEHSDALLDARMACLDERRQALDETVAILADADAEVIEHAGELTAKLPRLAACHDLTTLALRRHPSSDPQSASVVAGLEARLVRADALANAGRIAEAISIARAVAAEAEALEQPELLADALLSEARVSIVLDFDPAPMLALLGRALEIAIAEDLDALAAEAMIRRLYVRGLASGGSEAALADLPLAEALVARAGDEPELRALLLNNAGAIHLAAGDREAARMAFERSLELKQRLFGDEHLELAPGLANLGMLTPDAETGRALHDRMIDIYTRQLGPDHPRTLDARMLAAVYTADPERADAEFEQLCPRFAAIGELRFAGECELERGRLELGRGRLDGARRAFTAARGHLGDDQGIVLDAYLSLGTERAQPMLAALREHIAEVDAQPEAGGWWIRREQAELRLLVAHLLADERDSADRVEELERALADLDAIADQAQPVIKHQRMLADTQAALALALDAAGIGERSRIASLAGAARAFYAQWPQAYARRLDELASVQSATDIEVLTQKDPQP